ncbi:hypothetical protein Tco_1407339 [Tanacetum coccineum]
MNQDFYNSNLSGFDQFQPPQFPVNYPPQETSKEILQAQEDLMEAIQAFLKEYDHIPPNEKCMALLLAEEKKFKIKQAIREEQNQPEVLQELLLKLMNDLQILKGIQQEKKETAAQSFTPYWNFSMIDDEEARDNFLKDVCTFLRKFSRIPFGVTPKVILIAWERCGKIKDALMDEQYQQEDIQELMSKLLEDVRNIEEVLSKYINCPSWNRPIFYDYDDDEYTIIYSKPKAITPDLPIEEPDNSLNPSTFDALNDHSEILSDSNDDDTSSDDDDFEEIKYVILEEVNVDQEEKEFDLEDILQIQDVILRENNDSFVEESDTSLSHLDNSLPEFETFSDDMEETRSGSTTTHANYSLPEYDSFLFKIWTLDQEGLISIDNSNNTLLELPEFESFHFNPSFPRPPPEPPNVEICLHFEPDAPRTIPSHLPSVFFSHLSPTPRSLFYLAPSGVKIRSLTLASLLRAGGISLGWNFHDYPDFEDSRAHDLHREPLILELCLEITIVLTLCGGVKNPGALSRKVQDACASRKVDYMGDLASNSFFLGLEREAKYVVRSMQKSQENGQNWTNTDTGTEREYKSRENAIKGQMQIGIYVAYYKAPKVHVRPGYTSPKLPLVENHQGECHRGMKEKTQMDLVFAFKRLEKESTNGSDTYAQRWQSVLLLAK